MSVKLQVKIIVFFGTAMLYIARELVSEGAYNDIKSMWTEVREGLGEYLNNSR